MKKKKMFFLYGFISGAFLLFLLGSTVSNVEDENDFPQGYRIISPPVPDELYFCGERVPMDNFEVYERIDRELIVNTYFHSATILRPVP
jgi:hypothetical protein